MVHMVEAQKDPDNITTTQKYGVNGEVDFIRVGGNPFDIPTFLTSLTDLSDLDIGQYPIVKGIDNSVDFSFG